MNSPNLKQSEEIDFTHFLLKRQLRDQIIPLLKDAKKEDKELRAAKNLTYSQIVDNLMKALTAGKIDHDELLGILDKSEIAGKQHVMIFRLPSVATSKVFKSISTPHGREASSASIKDFITVPTTSSFRKLLETDDEIMIKIVTKRQYWDHNILEDTVSRVLIEKNLKQERSAIIIKCNKTTGIVQIRIPPRQHGLLEAAKSVYDFTRKVISSHYDLNKNDWFKLLAYFPIDDAFPNLMNNREDFELWADTPRDTETKTQISRRGRPTIGKDLRDENAYTFSSGFSRLSARGHWKCPSNDNSAQKPLYVHMNSDKIRLGPSSERKIARLFIPNLCEDGDIEHVISRIQSLI